MSSSFIFQYTGVCSTGAEAVGSPSTAPAGIGGPGSPGSSSSPISYCLTCVSGGTGSVVGVSTRIGTGRVILGPFLLDRVGRGVRCLLHLGWRQAWRWQLEQAHLEDGRWRFVIPGLEPGQQQSPDAGGVQCGDEQQYRRGAPGQAFVVNVSVDPHPVPGTCCVAAAPSL
ncbi:MAG: hypothetical protein V9E93_06280 [Steroidobacteraceae bacterium]